MTAGWAKAGRQLGHKSWSLLIVIHHHFSSGLKTKAANLRVDFTFGIFSFHILCFSHIHQKKYTNIIAVQIHLQCVSIKPSSQIKVTFSFQFQNYLFSTKLSIAEFYEINGLLILSWTQNIFFYTYFLQLSFEFQSIRMSYRRKMWTTGIDCAKFAFGIRLLQGPEIERDGDCIVTVCLSQVLSDIWSLSVIINNDIVIIIYHHHQNHHHQHQLDKTIRVARVTTVVSHSAIMILR